MFYRVIFVFCMLFSFISAKCQQPSFIAPDFTFTDVNGNTHTLYDYLDQGKTVFIDAFTTWCGPCWTYHNSHAFENLFQQHGPAGMNGVNSNTTNDVMVFSIEVEGNNATSAIFGSGGPLVTHGNWTTGIHYPVVDVPPAQVANFCGSWDIDAYPTIYMICRDRIATQVSAGSASSLYQGIQNSCPNYAPTAAADARFFAMRAPVFHCSQAAPQIIFQNYSTQPLQSAKIKTYYDYILVDSFYWTGNISAMDFINVTLPFMSLPASIDRWPFSFKVTAANDIRPANDYSGTVYNTRNYQNPDSLPFSENFDFPSQSFTDKWILSNKLFTTAGGDVIGPDGLNDLIVMAVMNTYVSPGFSDTMYAGNYNFQGIVNPQLSFYLCYSQMYNGAAYSNDELGIMVSTDCGANWTSVWNKSGSQLATTASSPTGYFMPTAGNQWQKKIISLFAAANQPHVVLAFTAKADLGSNIFIDSILLAPGPLAVHDLADDAYLNIYPNPVKDNLYLTLSSMDEGVLTVTDVQGRCLKEYRVSASTKAFVINVSELEPGYYVLSFSSENRNVKRGFIKTN